MARTSLSALALCLTLPACTTTGDYEVVTSWLINSSAPNADRCDEQGIASVRLTAFGPRGTQVFEADCAQTNVLSDGQRTGAFRTGFEFDYDTFYEVSVETVDADGIVLDGYDADLIDSFPVDAVELPTLDVFQPFGASASFDAGWTLRGDIPPAGCAEAGVTGVAFVVAAASDTAMEFVEEVARVDCEDGTFDSIDPVLAQGNYLMAYEALDETLDPRDEILQRSAPISVIVPEADSHASLPDVDFDL